MSENLNRMPELKYPYLRTGSCGGPVPETGRFGVKAVERKIRESAIGTLLMIEAGAEKYEYEKRMNEMWYLQGTDEALRAEDVMVHVSAGIYFDQKQPMEIAEPESLEWGWVKKLIENYESNTAKNYPVGTILVDRDNGNVYKKMHSGKWQEIERHKYSFDNEDVMQMFDPSYFIVPRNLRC